jgi:hypothetical protein
MERITSLLSSKDLALMPLSRDASLRIQSAGGGEEESVSPCAYCKDVMMSAGARAAARARSVPSFPNKNSQVRQSRVSLNEVVTRKIETSTKIQEEKELQNDYRRKMEQ